jgi:hypothetical protein
LILLITKKQAWLDGVSAQNRLGVTVTHTVDRVAPGNLSAHHQVVTATKYGSTTLTLKLILFALDFSIAGQKFHDSSKLTVF